MILRIVLPFAFAVAALPALAQDRTLPAGAYQNPPTYGSQRTFDYGVGPTLLQGRSEAPVTAHRSHRSKAAH